MIRASVNFHDINVLPHDLQVVEGVHTCVNQVTGQPERILLKVAIDKRKAESDALTFTIYIPISNRNNADHQKLLSMFRSGEPFVAVSCRNLKVFRKRDSPDKQWEYYGFAESFVVVDYEGGQEQC